MPNKNYSDVVPGKGSSGYKNGDRIGNVDGRESGEGKYPDNSSAQNAKYTFSPNEDVKMLNGGKDRPGAEQSEDPDGVA